MGEHSGTEIHGLGTKEDIEAGDHVFVIPPWLMLKAQPQVFSSRFSGVSSDVSRLALWLSEKKAELVDSGKPIMTDEEAYWSTYIRSLPSLEEYKASGMPLAASDEDAAVLAKLPQV